MTFTASHSQDISSYLYQPDGLDPNLCAFSAAQKCNWGHRPIHHFLHRTQNYGTLWDLLDNSLSNNQEKNELFATRKPIYKRNGWSMENTKVNMKLSTQLQFPLSQVVRAAAANRCSETQYEVWGAQHPWAWFKWLSTAYSQAKWKPQASLCPEAPPPVENRLWVSGVSGTH